MRFSFTKQQDMLSKSFVDYLSAKCTSEERRKWLESEDGFSKDVWREISELGWPGLMYDEKYGGMSGTFLETFILFEELGKYLLPSPLFASAILAGMLIESAGNQEQKQEHLPAIIEGKRIYTLAFLDSNGSCVADAPAITAVRTGDTTFRLDGVRLFVPYAHIADKIVVCANLSTGANTGPTLFIVDARVDGLHLTSLRTITGEKLYAVCFEKAPAYQKDIIGEIGEGSCQMDRLLPKAIMLKCAEMIGVIKQVLDMTVSHAKGRHQFGRPLGSFQAIQHYFADMAADLEGGRLLAYHAATLLDGGCPCVKEVAMAKAWCSDACTRCCAVSHQIHGAYGFTEECDLHLYTKHAKTAELMFGHSWFHRSRVADAMGL